MNRSHGWPCERTANYSAGIALDLDLSPQTKDAGMHVAALVKQRGIDPAATRIRFGFDPIGAAATAGGSPMSWDALTPIFNAAISDLAARGFRGPFAPADGRVIHNTGGTEAQELAYVLAVAVTYLRALEAGGIALGAARITELLRHFDGQLPVALGAYNAGEAAAARWLPPISIDSDIWIENIPYNETRAYVRRVLWHSLVFRWLETGRAQNAQEWLGSVATTASSR